MNWLLALVAFALLAGTGCSKQAKAGRHLKRANSYLTSGDYEKAEIEYLNVFRLSPTNSEAVRHLANIYYEDELSFRSAAFFNSLKKLDPTDFESRGKLARIFLNGGALKEAREEAQFVLKNSPTNEEAILVLIESSATPDSARELPGQIESLRKRAGDNALFHLADGYLALRDKKLSIAETEFKKATALDPKSAAAQSALGSLYMFQTNMALAERALKAAAELSPIRSVRQLRLVTMRLQAKDTNGAYGILNSLTSKAPDYTPAWMLTARIALDQKDFDRCATALNRVITRTPDHYEALSLRAEMYMAQAKPEKAFEDLERLSAQYPKSPQARYQLAVAQFMAKDLLKALASARQAAALDRNFTPAILLQAELNLRTGDFTSAIASLNELIKRDPRIPRAYLLLAAAYQSSGKSDDALAAYNSALKQFPGNIEMYLLSGVIHRLKGDNAEARKIFESILKTRPDDPQANAQLVEMDIEAKSFAAAAQRVQTWISREPQNPEPEFQMAKIAFAQNDFKTAQGRLEKVIALNKDALPAYVMLARAYYATKESDAALEKFQLALSRNPRDTISLLMVGIIYDEKKDFDRSREAYEKLLAISPKNPAALNNLAVIYADHMGQLDKAYTLARQAAELRPDDGAIADTLGWILVKRGDYNLALAPLRQAGQANPSEPEIISHLGIAEYMAGNETLARATLARALSLAPAFNGRDQAEQCLTILNLNPATPDQKVIATLQKRLAEKPADLVALTRLSTIYSAAGKYMDAAAMYQAALVANPKLSTASARLADLYDQRLNDSAKALEFAKNARKLDSDDPDIAHIAGRIASKSSDPKEAQWGLGLLQESLKNRPEDSTVAFDFAWASYMQGRLADAESAAKTALDNPASNAAARQFLDFIPLTDPIRAGQNQKRIQDALAQDSSYLPALAAAAALSQQNGDFADATKRWEQILSRYPGFAPALRGFAILSAEKPADPAKAVAIAARAREAFPDDFEVAKAVGILQFQAADYSKASRTLENLAVKRPDDASVQYFLGMSHYKLKQNSQSKTALQSAIRLQAKPSYIAEAQRILAELK